MLGNCCLSSYVKRASVSQLLCFGLAIPTALLTVNTLAAQDHRQGEFQDQASSQTAARGVPYDWSHRHLIFSHPGTAEDALKKGTYDHWFQTVNDSRFQQQQVRRHHNQDPNAWQREFGRRREKEYGGLWGQSLGSNTAAVGAGMYPAKFSFDSDNLNCANATEPDYVVYNTSVAPSAAQASVIAFDNIYTTTCTPSNAVPTVYWSYNTGGTVSTSVVLSEDGWQAAFVQTVGTKASLVLLKYRASEGTSATSAVTPGNVQTCTSTTGSCATQAGAYATCRTTNTTSCELELQFSNVGGATPNDTNSPPFYDYKSDTMWVGDDSGYLHKFTGVFKSTATEVTTGGWPIQVSTKASPILTGAVYDSGASGLIFVNDATGYLYSISAASPTGSVLASTQMECGVGFKDPPVVDSTTEYIYDFIAYGCDGTHNSYINRFAAGTSVANPGYGTPLSFANGGANNPNTGVARVGTFDDTYYSGNGTTGNIYDCVDGRIYKVPVALGSVATFSTPVTTVGSAANCSAITEFYGTSATTTVGTGGIGGGNGNTTLPVTSTTGFTAGPTGTTYYIQIESEILGLTTVNTGPSTLTVTRGALGTTRAAHNAGVAVNEIHDWLFLSVLAGGNATVCTGSCVYNYDILGGTATGTPAAGLQVVGGTSGISVDNSALNGGSQVYFSFGASATGTIKCPNPSGASSGGCAVQATQLGLN